MGGGRGGGEIEKSRGAVRLQVVGFFFLKSSAHGTVYIMQIRERNEEGMGKGRKKTFQSFSFSSMPALLAACRSHLRSPLA